MSKEYRFIDPLRKKEMLGLQAFLAKERGDLVARIKKWSEDNTASDYAMVAIDDAIAELSGYPKTADFDYCEDGMVIGQISAGQFRWSRENGSGDFGDMRDVEVFSQRHPMLTIEDEYGKEYTFEEFKQELNPSPAPAQTRRSTAIVIKHGNILTSNAAYIAQQVNCMGVMGAGLAKSIREKYPAVYDEYRELCKRTEPSRHLLGTCQLVQVTDGVTIANCFGQVEYGRDKQYTDYSGLRKALIALKFSAEKTGGCIAIPYNLGCGLAGGKWNQVLDIIDDVFRDYPDGVEIWSLDGKTEFVLRDETWGYYGGLHQKYHDMLSLVPKVGAMRYRSKDEAEKEAARLNKCGYNFQLVEC